MQLGGTDDGPRMPGIPDTLLVTSAASRGEKADLAANLAVVLAQAGLEVILVDADLRHPALHEAFGMANETGLQALLAGSASLEQCLLPTAVANLSLLASGGPADGAVISAQQLSPLLKELGNRADAVLFDAPPALMAADTLLLASLLEGTILAVAAGSTRRELAVQALQRLQGVRATVLGAVLIGVRGSW
jgi:capsular exopolysaccharide synthesis family protein